MSESWSSRSVRISRVIYRVIVASYPAEIRREHGVEMVQAFGNRCSEQSQRGGISGFGLFWLSTLRDFFTTAPAEWQEWFTARRQRRRRHSNSPPPRREIVFASMMSDVRYAVRQLIKRPGFTVVAVVTLALGIGANTAIFSVVNAVLLRPLAFEDPDRIVVVWESNPARGWPRFPASPANYLDWVEQNEVFAHLAGYTTGTTTLTGELEPARLNAAYAWANLFSVLGVPPMLGRSFTPEENQPGNDGVAIVSHRLWQTRFGGDPNLIGRTITLDDAPVEVVGVLPAEFAFRAERDVWRPLTFNFDVAGARGAHYIVVLARLDDGVSIERATAAMTALASSLEQEYPATNSGWNVNVVSLREQTVGAIQSTLLLLLAAVGVVLLIACANVANLLLARATSRRQEMAVRAALGAGRGRLVRQLVTEGFVLATVGGVAGVFAAWAGVRGLLALNPGNVPRMDTVSLDGTVMLFTTAIALFTGGLFGLAPALHGSRAEVHDGLRAGGARSGGATGHGPRNALLVSQVAMTLMLVVGSTLLLKSFRSLLLVDPGFDPENVVAMQMRPTASRYAEPQQVNTFYDLLTERLEGIAGISSVGLTSSLPLFGGASFSFTIDGRPEPRPDEVPSGSFRSVSPGYLRAMGIPLLRGRGFAASDNASAPSVVLVNESLVRRYFPNEDPIGQSIDIQSRDASCPCEIVGVVSDVRQRGLTDEHSPGYYLPNAQTGWRTQIVVARSTLTANATISAMRGAVASVDPSLPVYNIQTLEERLADAVAEPRFNTVLLSIFAAIAMTLAIVGIYGVMSYNVSQRTQELGVRVALGAAAGKIMLLVVSRGLALAGVGVAIGLAGAYGTTRFLSGMLFGVDPLDPATFGAVAGLILAVAALAAYLPARRAAHVDPVTALRGE